MPWGEEWILGDHKHGVLSWPGAGSHTDRTSWGQVYVSSSGSKWSSGGGRPDHHQPLHYLILLFQVTFYCTLVFSVCCLPH